MGDSNDFCAGMSLDNARIGPLTAIGSTPIGPVVFSAPEGHWSSRQEDEPELWQAIRAGVDREQNNAKLEAKDGV